jgi:hypothetical protein
MPKYNRNFTLSLHDIDQIETALRTQKNKLSERRLALLKSQEPEEINDVQSELVNVADLLGRLHDQKIFYRPKMVGEAPYVSG